jgi:hypothetical protein
VRYIDLSAVIKSIPNDALEGLKKITVDMEALGDDQKILLAANGNPHWSPIKIYLENASNRKCWYTESKNPGFPNDVEHFRPKGQVKKGTQVLHWYWFLAFNPINYRLSAHFPNRLSKNSLYAQTGGKGDQFPLLNNSPHAKSIRELPDEKPVLLDPCNPDDVDLLAFSPDGRPAIAPKFHLDKIAKSRLEKSNLLLNLDYPTFNEGREILYNKIKDLVSRGDKYIAQNINAIEDVKFDLRQLMHQSSEYSSAAECYVRCFRDRSWIDELF